MVGVTALAVLSLGIGYSSGSGLLYPLHPILPVDLSFGKRTILPPA